MATTIIDPPGPLDPEVTTAALLEVVHAELVSAHGDLDKTTDAEDASYYAGLVDAYRRIEYLLTGKEDLA